MNEKNVIIDLEGDWGLDEKNRWCYSLKGKWWDVYTSEESFKVYNVSNHISYYKERNMKMNEYRKVTIDDVNEEIQYFRITEKTNQLDKWKNGILRGVLRPCYNQPLIVEENNGDWITLKTEDVRIRRTNIDMHRLKMKAFKRDYEALVDKHDIWFLDDKVCHDGNNYDLDDY